MSEDEGGAQREPFGPQFWWLAIGRGVDSLGNAMHPIALGFAVLALFDSVAALGVIVGFASLGHVMFILAGGVVADRLPRAVVLVLSNLVAGLLQFAVVAILLAQWDALGLLAALSFFTGAAASFDGPASTALVPQVLAKQELAKGNAILLLARRLGFFGGASSAGLVVALVGPESALAFNAVSFVVAGFCFSRVKVAPLIRTSDQEGPWRSLLEGWVEFRSRTWLWVVVAAFFVINACWSGGFHVLGIAIADDTFGPTAWGLVIGAEGLGAMVGGVFLSRRPILKRPLVAGMRGAIVGHAPLAALALGLDPWLIGASSVAGGVGMMTFGVAWDTALQSHIPADRLARVAALDGLGSFAAIPIGGFIVGPLAEVFGVLPVVRGAAVLALGACVVALLNRDVRALGMAPSEHLGEELGQA